MSVEGPNPQPHPRLRGRPFAKGNGGRKPGSRNRTTMVAEALLKGEEVELVRKAIALAKAGDVQMLKFLLDRILPKDRAVCVDVPQMEAASDAIGALGAIIDAVGSGRIAPNEGSVVASLFVTRARMIKDAELNLRLDDIEKRQKEIQCIVEKLLLKEE
jgi:hypothetical protein